MVHRNPVIKMVCNFFGAVRLAMSVASLLSSAIFNSFLGGALDIRVKIL